MWKSKCIALLTLLITPAVSAEIYKCVAKNGTDLYQNFPCELDSTGWTPPTTQVPKTPPVGSDSKATRSSAGSLEVATGSKTPPAKREPRAGMSMDEVKAIWGEPISGFQDEVVEGRIEVWSYGTSRSVQFDQTGRVMLVRP